MTKAEVRNIYMPLRRAFSQVEKENAQAEILDKILSLGVYKNADAVLAYASYGNEISVDNLVKESLNQNKKVFFPICDTKSETMRFYRVERLDDLNNIGSYGIREPRKDGEEYVSAKNALCIVPALVFDREGYRVGHGKGYYDKFLSSFKGKTLGVVANDFLLPEVPRDKYDISVDCVVTENEIIYVK